MLAPVPTGGLADGTTAILVSPRPTPGAIRDFPTSSRPPGSRPDSAVANTAKIEIKVVPTPRPKPKATARKAFVARSTGHHVTGTATWYCKTGVSACHHSYSGGMYAAAGGEIRIGAWRGRSVQVCSGGRCITVRLIDWCACGGARIIDLYSDAFRRLAPLSAGGIHVTVKW